MFLLGDWLGPVGEHNRDTLLNPVGAPQPRVVEQVLVGEVHKAALIDRAHEDLQQRVPQGHGYCLLR